jgi:hypothetical protein
MYCATCGAAYTDGSAFCTTCGQPVNDRGQAQALAAPAQQVGTVQPVMLVMQTTPAQPPYVAPSEQLWVPGRGQATASMVLGLVGLITSCIPFVGLIMGGIGLILGFLGMRSDRKGQAITGVVLNSLWVMTGVGYIVFFSSIASMISSYGAN